MVLRAARGDLRRHDPARRLPEGHRGCDPQGGRPLRAGLHRLGHHLGRHAGDRRRRADLRPAEGLERLALLRPGHAEREGGGGGEGLRQYLLRRRPEEVAGDHGGL